MKARIVNVDAVCFSAGCEMVPAPVEWEMLPVIADSRPENAAGERHMVRSSLQRYGDWPLCRWFEQRGTSIEWVPTGPLFCVRLP